MRHYILDKIHWKLVEYLQYIQPLVRFPLEIDRNEPGVIHDSYSF